jgi:CBS domain-containing protein
MPTCSEVMTANPTCCTPHESAQQAAQLMRSENVGSIPVIENQSSKQLVGIVTDRDLALKVVAEGRAADQTHLHDVMTANPVFCRAEDDLGRALSLMAEHQVRRIPVVNDANQVVGIIAQADVALMESDSRTGEVVEQISKPS